MQQEIRKKKLTINWKKKHFHCLILYKSSLTLTQTLLDHRSPFLSCPYLKGNMVQELQEQYYASLYNVVFHLWCSTLENLTKSLKIFVSVEAGFD